MIGAVVAGEDDTTVLARAPGDPGRAWPSETGLHTSMGEPQRAWLPPNADFGKPARELGIWPTRLFPDTLKSCKPGTLISLMGPENRFASRRRVSRWVRWLREAGIWPERLLWERSRR